MARTSPDTRHWVPAPWSGTSSAQNWEITFSLFITSLVFCYSGTNTNYVTVLFIVIIYIFYLFFITFKEITMVCNKLVIKYNMKILSCLFFFLIYLSCTLAAASPCHYSGFLYHCLPYLLLSVVYSCVCVLFVLIFRLSRGRRTVRKPSRKEILNLVLITAKSQFLLRIILPFHFHFVNPNKWSQKQNNT